MAIVQEDIIGGRGGYGFGGGGEGLGALGVLTPLLLLGLLGGRGGLGFGGNDRGGCERECVGIDGLNNLQGSIDTTAILGKLASIEGAIPFNEAQVQLALAQAVSTLTAQATGNTQGLATQATTNANAVQNGLTQLLLGQLTSTNTLQTSIASSTAALQSALCSIDTNIDKTGMLITNTVRDDGNATRALITTNLISQLQADKVILANELAEQRHERNRDSDRHGIEITMVSNQAQAQLQFQEQRQALSGIQAHLFGVSGQLARATNSNVVVGSTGVGTSQTANPTNVNS